MRIFEQNNIRISLISPCVLRVERGAFTDLPTQTVLNRDFGEFPYKTEQKGNVLSIKTDMAEFNVNISDGKIKSAQPYGMSEVSSLDSGILPGTARTLDRVNGATATERGILSKNGVSILDDSKSLLLAADGSILPREKCSDIYCFACGADYIKQLRAFFDLTGDVPLIPKYALGNWWSRYKAYTQDEYQKLMQTFIDRKIPITVATIDMDWHWTDVVNMYGDAAKAKKPSCPDEIIFNLLLHGWTGYSWNTDLFPNYRELLTWLQSNGFRVTLNVHPSQGVRFFEDQYAEMCRRMGKDPSTKEPVDFDPTDLNFMKAYFEVLHHPFENEGVDFWWLDWQQGTKTKIPGLDPLWALNHYHYLDSAREDRRGLILSRYSGLGSHRYPLGFSGDTHATWKSLDFQPYFTNSASNAGYTWWSHDIGGHMHGVQDDELYLRWLQYGVFSPINRLHSSNSDFMGKEPWKRSWAVNKISEDFLRLRHRLIPYLYSASYRTHTVGEPICMPMYYRYNTDVAYEMKNQYVFGGQLLVCPITEPTDKRLNLASVKAWLPEGRWTDIFNGRIYEGGREITFYRDLDSIPVLAPAGAIIPMYRDGMTNDLSMTQPLEINVWRGNGRFELCDDDGTKAAYESGRYAITTFTLKEDGDRLQLKIETADPSHILPDERVIYIKPRDLLTEEIKLTLTHEICEISIDAKQKLENEPLSELKSMVLTRVQGGNDKKSRRFKKKLPRFVSDVLSEFDAFYGEEKKI